MLAWIFEAQGWRAPLLLAASTGYMAVAIGGDRPYRAYGWLVIAALGCCWLGDFFGPGNFLLGVAFFLAAHLLLIPAFVVRGTSLAALGSGLIVSGIGTAAVVCSLAMNIPPGQKPLIYAYAFVIALMLGFALGTWGRGSRGLIPIAAIIFFVSDLFLAQTAFLGGGRIWTITGYPLYYLACLLFAWSVARNPVAAATRP